MCKAPFSIVFTKCSKNIALYFLRSLGFTFYLNRLWLLPSRPCYGQFGLYSLQFCSLWVFLYSVLSLIFAVSVFSGYKMPLLLSASSFTNADIMQLCDFSCFCLPTSILVSVGIDCHLVLLQVFFNAFEFCYPDLSLWVDLD